MDKSILEIHVAEPSFPDRREHRRQVCHSISEVNDGIEVLSDKNSENIAL